MVAETSKSPMVSVPSRVNGSDPSASSVIDAVPVNVTGARSSSIEAARVPVIVALSEVSVPSVIVATMPATVSEPDTDAVQFSVSV